METAAPHTLIVFDIDSTLVPHSEGLLLEPFFEAFFKLASQHSEGLDYEEFRKLCDAAYLEHGCCVRVWVEGLPDNKISVVDAYGHIAMSLLQPVIESGLVTPDPILKAKLRQLEALGAHLVLLTQGHRNYSVPLLRFTELDDVFPEHTLHDIVAVNGAIKRTEAPYIYLRETYPGFARYVMVEDTPGNLGPAHNQGYETHFLEGKQVKYEHLDAIGHIHKNIHAAVDALLLSLQPKG